MQDHEAMRRSLLLGGGLGALALAALADRAQAQSAMGATETANVKVVNAWCASWNDPKYDPDKAVEMFMAPDCHVRLEDSAPFVTGRAAVAAAFKAATQPGVRYRADVLSTWATGPIVVNHRTDVQVGGAKDGAQYPIVGFFYLKNGLIREWTDYVIA
jgi:limonene-1,2-epoxide hydrolase